MAAVVGEWKVVVRSRHLPSVRQPRKQMESSGVAVGLERLSSAVLTVQSLARAVEGMKTKTKDDYVAVDDGLGWVDARFAG